MGLFKRKPKWLNYSGNINLVRDIKDSDIRKLIAENNIRQIQLYSFTNPNIKTWETLNQFFKKYPKIGLRILWYEKFDQSFYKELTELRDFTISSYLTKDFSFLKSNLRLKSLGVEQTKSKAADLTFLKEFQDLETLYIDGMKKGLESISKLSKLKTLSLRGVKMENLDLVENLDKLTELNLLYGSYKDLSSISKLRDLTDLEISRVRQIQDYSFLKNLINLKKLSFEGMSQLNILPDLSELKSLRKIQIDNNSRLRDISSISQIPNLEELLIFFPENFKASMRKKLTEQAYKIVMESKTIKSTSIWLRVNNEQRRNLREKEIDFWNYSKEAEELVSRK